METWPAGVGANVIRAELPNFVRLFDSVLFNLLGIKCRTIIASELCLEKSPPGGIVCYQICKKLGAISYLSGAFGKNYLDETPFRKDGISVVYQDFTHPKYYQKSEPFVSNLSILDLIFSLTPQDSLDVIRGKICDKQYM